MQTTRLAPCCALLLWALVVAGCATTGAASPSAKPVFYPNAKLKQVGQPQADADAQACEQLARNAGLTPQEQDNAVLHDAAKGASIGGAAGAVGALVSGRGPGGVVNNGLAGAAVGGSVGAVNGAFQSKPSQTYRHFVQRCLKDKGYDVIGWN